MRHIIKGQADSNLQKEHQKPPTQLRSVKKRWASFRKKGHYGATREQCLKSEQFGLCGYSEVGLINHFDVTQELGAHLEHIEPKSKKYARTFDHFNLIACAIDDSNKRGIAKHEVFGGHFRGNWFNSEAFIHPLLSDCNQYFHYELSSGRIVPREALISRDQAKARLTIYKLNLNSPVLVKWRFNYMNGIKKSIFLLSKKSPEKLSEYAKKVLLPDNNTILLQPFHSASCQIFGPLSSGIKQSENLS